MQLELLEAEGPPGGFMRVSKTLDNSRCRSRAISKWRRHLAWDNSLLLHRRLHRLRSRL